MTAILGTPSEFQQANPRFFDVSGDSVLSPIDALMVINCLARQAAIGESESADSAAIDPIQAAALQTSLPCAGTVHRDVFAESIDLAIPVLF